MVRSKRSQAAHDRKVRQEADKLKRQSYKVNADVSGFQRPKTISGYRPDIIAIKNKQWRIIEVETEDSKNSARDSSQQQAFRQAADLSENTTFRRVIADE
jgi:hypothetical protein